MLATTCPCSSHCFKSLATMTAVALPPPLALDAGPVPLKRHGKAARPCCRRSRLVWGVLCCICAVSVVFGGILHMVGLRTAGGSLSKLLLPATLQRQPVAAGEEPSGFARFRDATMDALRTLWRRPRSSNAAAVGSEAAAAASSDDTSDDATAPDASTGDGVEVQQATPPLAAAGADPGGPVSHGAAGKAFYATAPVAATEQPSLRRQGRGGRRRRSGRRRHRGTAGPVTTRGGAETAAAEEEGEEGEGADAEEGSSALQELLSRPRSAGQGGEQQRPGRDGREAAAAAAARRLGRSPSRPLCVRMPPLSDLRILMVALPADAYTITTGGTAGADDGMVLVAGQGTAASSLAAYINNLKAMWSYAEGLSRRSGDIELGRQPSYTALRDTLTDDTRYLGSGGPAIARDPSLLRALNATPQLMRPLQRAAEEWVFSSVDALDLERIVIAGFMTSPYVHIVEGRNITREMLREADYVFVPFPLTNMKGRPSVLRKYREIMERHVPTLTVDPRKHLYVWGRIFRDAIRWKDFYNTMRPMVRRYPFRLTNVITFEPHRMIRSVQALEGGLKRQHTVPYPSIVRKEMAGVSDSASRGASSPGVSSGVQGSGAGYGGGPLSGRRAGAEGDPHDPADPGGVSVDAAGAAAVPSGPLLPPFAPIPPHYLDTAALVEAYSVSPVGIRELYTGPAAAAAAAAAKARGEALSLETMFVFPPPRLECDPLPPAAGDDSSGPPPTELTAPALPAGCTEDEAMAAVRLSRPLLAVFFGTTMGTNAERTSALKSLYSCPQCAVLDPHKSWSNLAHSHWGILWAYRNAVFCLQPPGDSPSRKGFFDALLLGCIPVIPDNSPGVADRTPVLPYAWAIPWREIALILPVQVWHSDLEGALRSVSAVDLRARQARLSAVAPLLQWEWRLLNVRALFRRALTGAATFRAAVAAGAAAAAARTQAATQPDSPAAAKDGEEALGVTCARDAMDLLLATLYRRSPRRFDVRQRGGSGRQGLLMDSGSVEAEVELPNEGADALSFDESLA